MREHGPSRTAIGMALQRALHQVIDEPPVFVDPMAVRIIGARGRHVMERNPRRFQRRQFGRQLRATLAARARVAEDALAQAVQRGVRQYVVLGAGLDTFAFRNPWPDVRVFEVDYPAMQAWKRQRLKEEAIAEPANAVFVPLDFERTQLGAALESAGYDSHRPAFFSWLGVTPYLEETAIWATLRTIAGLARCDGGVVFDYIAPLRSHDVLGRLMMWLVKRRVARLGEPLRSFLTPAAVRQGMLASGFTSVTDLDRSALNARFFQGRTDGLRVADLTHVLVAAP